MAEEPGPTTGQTPRPGTSPEAAPDDLRETPADASRQAEARAARVRRQTPAGPEGRESRLPSALRVIPTWLVVGFFAGFGFLALLALFGSPANTGRPDAQYVSGVVTEVEPGASPGTQTFLLKADDGETMPMQIRGTAEPSLPPGFLEGLVTRGTPVVVGYTVVDGQNVVLSILEAPRSSSSG
jgi:hypothetical protein